MRLTGSPETSVANNQYTMCEIPEERRSHLQRGGSLKSRHLQFTYKNSSNNSFFLWRTLAYTALRTKQENYSAKV